MLFLTPSQMVNEKNKVPYAKSNGNEKKTCFHTPDQMVTKKSMHSYAKSNGNTKLFVLSNTAPSVTYRLQKPNRHHVSADQITFFLMESEQTSDQIRTDQQNRRLLTWRKKEH